MQRYQVAIYDGKGEQLLVSVLEAPNRAVAQMMMLSQLCRNFATAPLVERIEKVVICQEGTNAQAQFCTPSSCLRTPRSCG